MSGDDSIDGVRSLVMAYYESLGQGRALRSFYATDEEAGRLGPVVKFGSGRNERFRGEQEVAAAVAQVTARITGSHLRSRALQIRRQGDLAWFSDEVWWSGYLERKPFASITRWTGLCLLCTQGWKLIQLHVSEEVDE